jgi:predicted ester cyclase
MSRQGITVSEGVGRLFGGDVLLREVLYRLFRSIDDSDTVRPSEAIGPLEGTMDVGDMAEAVVLSGVEDLVLELDDLSRVTIDLTSTSGRFEVRGVGPGPGGLREFARRYTAAWCSQDQKRVAGFFAPEGSLKVNAAAPAQGRDAIAEVAHGFMTAFPDLRVSMDDVTDEGNRAKYYWTLDGTNTGPGGTGRRVRISGHESWQLSPEGLIQESVGQFDAADYQRQLDGRT